MSITAPPAREIILKQLRWKQRYFASIIFAFVIIQAFGIFLSVMNAYHQASFNSTYIRAHSQNNLFFLMILWIFISSLAAPAKANRKIDFTFISTRKISHITNIIFLLLIVSAASLLSVLSHYLIILLVPMIHSPEVFILLPGWMDLLHSFIWWFSCLLLTAAAGYFLSMIYQLTLLWKIVIGGLIFGVFYFDFMPISEGFQMLFSSDIYLITLSVLGASLLFFSSIFIKRKNGGIVI
ncbi:hypothetical protein [Alkalicoccus daliensis]|uniref:ABC transporter permease n=1 Tax=Alkalicoccus daliensis TaxID=745820 RepID=A0A1H0H1D4_9BACI|nr:hypothetical protein [Alkalicoccus daliensis]SDO12882.1 hypothetical protein SAMN04488053_107134 [Alkalicoccus daliensis]